ncbi:thioesterase family protein [Arenimonas sp.]|uniref:thioesterase family protein n=1 Tax=Arenimonas sp. TaxID=1872635 RepID=UPI0039E70D0A
MSTRTFLAGWGDMDFNSHMRNTAYLDKSADMRMLFFAEQGFSADTFAQRRFGPVVRKDEIDYYREFGLLEEIRASLSLAGLSEDGSRFRLRNEFHRTDGQLAARVTSLGGWLDLNERRLIAPPAELLAAMRKLPRSEDYQDLPSSLK